MKIFEKSFQRSPFETFEQVAFCLYNERNARFTHAILIIFEKISQEAEIPFSTVNLSVGRSDLHNLSPRGMRKPVFAKLPRFQKRRSGLHSPHPRGMRKPVFAKLPRFPKKKKRSAQPLPSGYAETPCTKLPRFQKLTIC